MATSQTSKKFTDILSILSDEDCLRMLQSVIAKKTLKISDFESPKRYYTRLAKLKEASLITKTDKAYEITALGCILYEVLQTAETAHSFSWELKVIDAIDETIPIWERHEIIKKLIPDESIQKFLLAKC
jgi:predicted transcriptional regulator